MSNLLAHAVGPNGRVVSFEPHPLIFRTLSRNVELLARRGADPDDRASRGGGLAVHPGQLPLAIDPTTFEVNKGTASLEHSDPENSTDVRTVRLDEEIDEPVGVMKLDVEMHELAALTGAESLLSRGMVRDILFEEHEASADPRDRAASVSRLRDPRRAARDSPGRSCSTLGRGLRAADCGIRLRCSPRWTRSAFAGG